MELPADLRQAGEELLANVSINELSNASKRLSQRYRTETRDGRMHLDNSMAAKAYIAARLPATFAAAYKALDEAYAVLGDFAPKTMLDAGSGPGTVFFAAREVFETLENISLFEQSGDIQKIGEQLCQKTSHTNQTVTWCHEDLSKQAALDALPIADLVTLGFVLDELHDEQQDRLISSLWQKCAGALVIIEPGTPAGWKRILRQRQNLEKLGAFIAAPCAHLAPCPLTQLNAKIDSKTQEDWCHFSVRLARSKLHRLTKKAEVPYEDEKFCYLVASRFAPQPIEARILSHPQKSSGRFAFKLCTDKGNVEIRQITRRDGDLFKQARRLEWGDALKSG
ncbi:small ribosomal subunit Rsm22 family protein [Bartonella sp. HY761]|uniref:small ribosomal subunit Rsm22 family protein n=1 Tax=Bartonella sp. HY761 TaxID=2979330 RepID=UPI0022057A92|nr:small ribosomal subunit Rsm22 family protein [Bartonella sp. HY761]UXN05835.1 methyltransferase type 11 [Bartonella sp. HY761]